MKSLQHRIVLSLLAIAFVGCRADSAEYRLREYFGISPTVSSDTLALSAAILARLKPGTPEAEVGAMLKAHGVGADGQSQYYPPTTTDTGLVRVEYDARHSNVLAKSYAVRLAFDSTRKLSGVRVTQWLTGP
jgi:hypothetical protein